MKRFGTHELREALACAAEGGQALHMMEGEWGRSPQGPTCFRRAKRFAHLFDQDAERLFATVRRLGVSRAFLLLEHPDTPEQHFDLCARPLERAEAECERVNE